MPKAQWEQLPPPANSAISNAQCDKKQQANSTRANSKDHPDHMVTDTLPMYVSYSVHHMPMETALHP